MEISTVKIKKSTKMALDQIKESNESYDEVIERLVSKELKKTLRDELIEGYKRIGKEDLELLEEWEVASAELDEDE